MSSPEPFGRFTRKRQRNRGRSSDVWDALVTNPWIFWLIIMLALAAIEMLTLDFLFLMMSLAALVTAGVSLVVDSFTVQVVLFAVVSVLLIFVIRPIALRRLNPVHAHHALQHRPAHRTAGHRARARHAAQRTGPAGGGRLDGPLLRGSGSAGGPRGVRPPH